jgi:hypothetical protein
MLAIRALLAAGLFLVPASVAAADDDVEEARALFNQAMEARTADDMARAEELLERSLELSPSAPTAFNLAEVQMRLGHACAAAELYGALLADDFGKLDPARTREVRRRQRAALRRTARLTVELEGASSAAVSVDARDALEVDGGTPAIVCIDAGAHRVTATAEGYATEVERFSVDAGQEHEVALTFRSIAADVSSPGDDVDEDDGGISPWWWVLAGALVVGAAVGITVALTSGGTDEVVDPVWGNKAALHF